jgi:hypothetical protein
MEPSTITVEISLWVGGQRMFFAAIATVKWYALRLRTVVTPHSLTSHASLRMEAVSNP